MYTEKQAREKWCPAARAIREWETPTSDATRANCIASDCMWWRWEIQADIDLTAPGQPPDKRHRGYCGMAGEP